MNPFGSKSRLGCRESGFAPLGLCAGAHTPWEARRPAATPTTAQPTLRVVGAVLVEIIAGGAGKAYGARGVGMWISDAST